MGTLRKFFKSCLNPRLVYNKYTGEPIMSECGSCSHCLNRKADFSSQLCELEESQSKYCFFVTLTYSNFYIPKLLPIRVGDEVHFKAVSKRDDNYGEILSICNMSDKRVLSLLKKTKIYRKYIGYAPKSDLQRFVKRVRYYCSKFRSGEIRFFGVSEYGPKTFRPHFHVLFYFDSDDVAQNIIEIVNKSWRFGIVDISASRHECGSYVAGYVNSLMSLPSVYKSPALCPFKSHSNYFGCKIFESLREKIYESPSTYFDEQTIEVFGKFKNIHPWCSVRNFFYPKIRGFSTLSRRNLLIGYTAYAEALNKHIPQYPYSSNPADLARSFIDIWFNFDSRATLDPLQYRWFKSISFILDLEADADRERNFNKLYCLFRTSRHFEFFVSPYFDNNYNRALDAIIDYYKRLDYNRLVDFYSLQEEFTRYSYDKKEYLSFYYCGYSSIYFEDCDEDFSSFDYTDTLYSNKWFRFNAFFSNRIAYNRVKHKSLSDSLGVLISK